MGLFYNKTFKLHDDYMTVKSAWEAIEKYIPKDKIIWEAFYGDGNSGKCLKEMGFNVIHEPIDFFESNKGDVIVTNPPFSKIKPIMKRLKELGKPFILILPASKVCTNYMREFFKDERLQLLVPRKRINFVKIENGEPVECKGHCNFDCFYYCWKMGLDRDITFLE